jgi:predicted DNA-binding transcriptional regulator YafY
VAEHTKSVLTLLKDNGVTPKWVQVGNETSNGFLWPVGKIRETDGELKGMWMGEDQMKQYAGLFKAGYEATKAVFPDALVIVHLDRGYNSELYMTNLDALKNNHVLGMTYQSYSRDEANTFEVEPYCLKAFKQRWYLVARSPYYDKIMIYSLDRVKWLGLTEKSFKYPKNFIPEEFFEDSFGIIADTKVKIETVKLKVSAGQANYLRSLTLHQTQKEIERTDEYSIFTVRLRPTFDFRQEILSQGCDIEVLEPTWFRDEIAEISKHMWNKYKND